MASRGRNMLRVRQSHGHALLNRIQMLRAAGGHNKLHAQQMRCMMTLRLRMMNRTRRRRFLATLVVVIRRKARG